MSAIGDITHALPVLRTLQHHWHETKITWIIGKNEHALVSEIKGVEFITFDKSLGPGAYLDLRKKLAGRRFDVLLHMQLSLRASISSLLINSEIKQIEKFSLFLTNDIKGNISTGIRLKL